MPFGVRMDVSLGKQVRLIHFPKHSAQVTMLPIHFPPPEVLRFLNSIVSSTRVKDHPRGPQPPPIPMACKAGARQEDSV